MTDEKTGYKILSYLAVFVALVCMFFKGFGTDGRELNRLQNDTDRTVADIKTTSASTGAELGRIKATNRELEEALERAKAELDRSRAVGDSIETSLAELERIINESRELARRNKSIINQVDAAN